MLSIEKNLSMLSGENKPFMLSVVMLNAVKLSDVAPIMNTLACVRNIRGQ
jgi:hypothetical protein